MRYAVTVGPLRLIMLDSTVPGADAGRLDAEHLVWLEAELARTPAVPTLLAPHHQPIATGLDGAERIGLPAADREGLRAVVERHAQVLALAAGHVHRTIAGALAGRPVLLAPSTYAQARLALSGEPMRHDVPGGGFAVHQLLEDGRPVSHVEQARDVEGWRG